MRRYYRCGEAGHYVQWCPRKAAHPKRGNVQQKEVRTVVLERKQEVKRKWAEGENKAEKQEWLVERSERGWITRREVVSVVTCGYCGEEGTLVGTNYVRLDSIHNMWCRRYGPKKEWLDREVATGRKLKIKCTECGKKWVAARREKVKKGEYDECRKAKRRKEAALSRRCYT